MCALDSSSCFCAVIYVILSNVQSDTATHSSGCHGLCNLRVCFSAPELCCYSYHLIIILISLCTQIASFASGDQVKFYQRLKFERGMYLYVCMYWILFIAQQVIESAPRLQYLHKLCCSQGQKSSFSFSLLLTSAWQWLSVCFIEGRKRDQANKPPGAC